MLTTQLEVEALNAFTWKSKCPLALEKPRKLSKHQLKSTRFEVLNGVAPCSSSRRNEARVCLVEFATSCIFLTSSCLSALPLSLSLSFALHSHIFLTIGFVWHINDFKILCISFDRSVDFRNVSGYWSSSNWMENQKTRRDDVPHRKNNPCEKLMSVNKAASMDYQREDGCSLRSNG